ncbi:DUF5691 domain-containing protein [Emticicia sp. 17c]|uniref:DUF5691 domain-containing protein n=1 Tax=Emticicia sp. 17c TaxID=3127704 RepID=UPI00301C3448
MEIWKQLINIALLGTDKLPLSTELLPPKIQDKLLPVNQLERESYFMKAAALTLAYKRAGEQIDKATMPAIMPAEAELQPYCSQKAILILKKLLGTSPRNMSLLALWMEKCATQSQIIPPDMLVSILELGAEKKARFLREDIRKIIGKRGEWLVKITNNWQYVLPQYEETRWQEGRIAERKEAFEITRNNNPVKAFEWLKASWTQETAKDKKEFLLMLEKNLSVAEEPFLEDFKATLVAEKKTDKAINKELLVVTNNLLQKIEKLKGKPVSQKVGLLGSLLKKIITDTMLEEEKEFLAEVQWQKYEETNKRLELMSHLSWSAEFSQKVLEGIASERTNHYQIQTCGPVILELCRCFHPQTVVYLEKLLVDEPSGWHSKYYNEKVTLPLWQALESISEIENVFK